MLAHKVFVSGLSDLAVQSLCRDIASGLTATGTGQSDAYEVTTAKAAFSTVAAGAGAVLSALAVTGDSQLIYNGGANALNVYPPAGANFNGQGANVPHSLGVATACEFHKLTATLWTGILSA